MSFIESNKTNTTAKVLKSTCWIRWVSACQSG